MHYLLCNEFTFSIFSILLYLHTQTCLWFNFSFFNPFNTRFSSHSDSHHLLHLLASRHCAMVSRSTKRFVIILCYAGFDSQSSSVIDHLFFSSFYKLLPLSFSFHIHLLTFSFSLPFLFFSIFSHCFCVLL